MFGHVLWIMPFGCHIEFRIAPNYAQNPMFLLHWPFFYCRRIICLDELCQLKFSSSDSSSDKFSNIKTGNRQIIRLNT